LSEIANPRLLRPTESISGLHKYLQVQAQISVFSRNPHLMNNNHKKVLKSNIKNLLLLGGISINLCSVASLLLCDLLLEYLLTSGIYYK
jgi:hypothetical protein